MAEWRFPSNDHGENKGLNDSGLATFRGTPLKSLAREICQNSLDAAVGNYAVVEFNMFTLPSKDVPGREQLLDAFERCQDFWKHQKGRQTKDFFAAATKSLHNDKCTFLRISDFNTCGLTGSRKTFNTNWVNLTKSSGASDKSGTAGGSYGIGKFAPFVCSDCATVFYSTYDKNEEKASQGVSRLVTFTRQDGEDTQGVGYYGNEQNTPVYDELNLDPQFQRKSGQYGTDIYIVAYKFGGNNWQEEIVVSILDGFLSSIWSGKLEVSVGDIKINKDTLADVIAEYKGLLIGCTEYYYKVLTSKETNWFVDENFDLLGEVKLGLLLTEQDAPKKVAMIRQTGMKIMDKDRLSTHVPFIGVMLINGDKINERLRLIENPEHTKWEPARSQHKNREQQLLNSLTSYIREKLESIVNTGQEESMDAIGVGNYIPDVCDDGEQNSHEEVISDRILEVEINPVAKRSGLQNRAGECEGVEEYLDGNIEPGGDEEAYFHPGGTTIKPDKKSPQPAHMTDGDELNLPRTIYIGADKFVCVCVDKSKGHYMLNIVPDRDGTNGILELFLSAETERYEAPLVKADLIGHGSVKISANKICGLEFSKGQAFRLSIEIDYYDYCSMEVIMHATEK